MRTSELELVSASEALGLMKRLVNKGPTTTGAGIDSEMLAPIFRRSMFWVPDRLAPSAWFEHVPFAFWLVDVFRPATIVELGTHNGVSYSALCQAVKSLGLPARCYAVDTWKGDEHAGFYSEEVYGDLAAFHGQHYGAFSRLVRSTFDEALPHFEDQSIDLLHIDGLHTYEAVRHDFDSWLPKLSPAGIVIFHDTNVRENNFGVFRLWSEIASGHLHFNFLHGHGLGVLGLGRNYSDPLRFLFDASENDLLVSSIRDTFAFLGKSIRFLFERSEFDRTLTERDFELRVLRDTLSERDTNIAALNREVIERDLEFGVLRDTLSDRDTNIAALDRGLAERDLELGALREAVTERDTNIAALDRGLAERDLELGALREAVTERDTNIAALDRTLTERDLELGALREALTERDANIAALDRVLSVRAAELSSLQQTVAARDTQIASLSQIKTECDRQLAALTAQADEIFNSTGWRLLAPLRWYGRQRQRALRRLRKLWSRF